MHIMMTACAVAYRTTVFKGGLQSVMQTNTLFTFGNSIFVKHDLLTEYLTLFWFVMLVNECKPEFQLKRSSKNAKFGQCLYLVVRRGVCFSNFFKF